VSVAEEAHSEQAQLLVQLQATQARLEAAELLAEASAVLSESLDHKVVLDRLARLVVRSFADWCVIDLIEDGEIRRVAGVHADPAKQPVLDELKERFTPGWDSPHPAVQVLKTGKPLIFPAVSEDDLRRLTKGDEHRRLGQALGVRSGLVVPLATRTRTLGSLTLGSGRPDRQYGQEELALSLALGRRAGVAIENALCFQQSQEAVRLRDEFLSVASHELNTPMAALMLSLEGLGTADPELQLDPQGMVHVAKLAERQGKRLTKLIGDLLDVTRLSRGALELHREEVDLGTLVREVVARYKPELERSGCEIQMELGGPGQERVTGFWDPMRIDQVVLNLVANAAKFGARKPIEIAVQARGEVARLTVTDHGIGVDPSQAERIFDRFERGVSSHRYVGLGLGLYICRRIVESHGGTIGVESQPGQGATFTVDLPRREPTEKS
jgi:signal transduction histidine kinase